MVFTKLLNIPTDKIPDHSKVLLIGKQNSCKTSFLFRYCQLIAKENPNQQVFFICPNQLFKVPLLINGLDVITKEASSRISILYPETLEDLIDFLARLFTLNQYPSAIVFDDLDMVLKCFKSKDQIYSEMLARLFALLADNIEHCKLASGRNCNLFVAASYTEESNEDLAIFKTIGEHYFDQVYTINKINLLGSTCTGFEIVDNSYKIIIEVQDDEIKLQHVLKKKN